MTLDQSDPDAIATFASDVVWRHPKLNVLVNNAGIQRVENLLDGGTADAEAQIATNLIGPIRLTAGLMPHLLAQSSAAIINVTSALGFMPQAMTPTYSATKAALHSYTQSLRFQLRHTAVEVIEMIPPWVQTELQGERGNNPQAMPLDEYIAETMQLLKAAPAAREIVVGRAAAFRHAEREGRHDAIFHQFNEMRAQEQRST